MERGSRAWMRTPLTWTMLKAMEGGAQREGVGEESRGCG